MQSPQRSSCSCAHWAWREPPTLKANRKHGATIAFRAHMCHNALALIGPAKSLHASPQSTKTLRCMLRPPLDAPHGFQELGGRQWRCFAANTNNNGNFVFKRTLLPRSLVQGQPKDPEKKDEITSIIILSTQDMRLIEGFPCQNPLAATRSCESKIHCSKCLYKSGLDGNPRYLAMPAPSPAPSPTGVSW